MAEAQALKLSSDSLSLDDNATPLMTQYGAIKAQHRDCLLFFRLGDFYELFFEDAVQASRALDIALTRRGQHQGKDIPMCGVPAHSYENYLARLIRQGFRVAICEQTEDPTEAKKRGGKAIVTREVVRIVTPGTVTEDSLLDARSANYLACLASAGEDLAISWIDLASGRPFTQAVTPVELGGALARLDAAEILLPQKLLEKNELQEPLAPWRERLVPQVNGRFDSANAERRLCALYQVDALTAFGSFGRSEITALGALLEYVELTQKDDLKHFLRPEQMNAATVMAIDPATRRNLELTKTLAGEKAGSLLATIDRTVTGAGARLLAARLVAPLVDPVAIARRHEIVEFWVREGAFRAYAQDALRQTPDLERALTRLALGRGGPRDLAAVRDALHQAEKMRIHFEILSTAAPEELKTEIAYLQEKSGVQNRLAKALAEELPLLARDGGFIAKGYATELDDLIVLRDDSRRLIASLQQKYADMSGIGTLKIRHNQVIGYYIEVTPTHADKLLNQKDVFIHRQSLASASRFTTVELSELDRKIREAADRALASELQIFSELVADVVHLLIDLRRVASALAEIDVGAALAVLAVEQAYTRPTVDHSLAFHIEGGRHPVVEQALVQQGAGATFIPNDCDLSPGQRLWLLTGPNMAGKSTFLRQNALITLLAQMGSFVPAKAVHLGVVDRLFSRVGASDDLARGHSTFMVEMVETAAILNQAGERALVILDEIGRGTATYDGLSIAWATIEHLHESNKCRALFATHYHELTSLSGRLPSLSCHTMRIKEWKNEVVFLHEVIDGVADRSYGIHVARMAGLPMAVIARAETVLKTLETPTGRAGADKLDHLPLFSVMAPKVEEGFSSEVWAKIKELDPDALTPKQALEALYEIKKLTAKPR